LSFQFPQSTPALGFSHAAACGNHNLIEAGGHGEY
jgi:hypothetical protein